MFKSIKNSIKSLSAVLMMFMLLFSFFITFSCIALLENNFQKNISDTVSDYVLNAINADDAMFSFTNRDIDSKYNETLDKLQKYKNANAECIERISLVSFSNSGGNYIFDTGGKILGDKLSYDKYLSSVKTELINGRNTWIYKKGGFSYKFVPVRTVDDKMTGYAIIKLKRNFIINYLPVIIGIYACGFIAAAILIGKFMRYLDDRIFEPLKGYTNASLTFSGKSEKNDIISSFSSREDEIGQLGKAIQKMFIDIINSSENLVQAMFDANHDGMTGVLNKRCYHDMEESFRSHSSICVIYFDVNNLKLMNDTLGHESGDNVIKHAADYIKKLLGSKDYCFRMGGDEFLVVMTECSYRDMDAVVTKLTEDEPVILNRDSDPLKCSLAYGYAYAKGSYDFGLLLAEAEENMYAKKAKIKKLLCMPDR